MNMEDQIKKKNAPSGQMVDIGGFRLHAIVRGQGKPVVILEPALGGFALQYAHIQSAISAFSQVIAYDRAGQGWSDISPNPRIPANLAGELRTLLDQLDLQPPFILVGHSFGGLLSRIFAGIYPKEVGGIVLIDSTHVNEYDLFPSIDKFVNQAAQGVRLLKMVSRLGLGKQVARLSLGKAAKSLSKEDLDAFLTAASQPKHHETMLAEFSQHRFYFGPQSEVLPSLGDTPLMVITAGNSVSKQAKIGNLTGEQVNAHHQKLQQNLVQLSTQGEQLILSGADHLSILIQPEYVTQIVGAIERMVEKF
jgi:pimeloyl-ACP methyl ester carboxylesterase